MDINVIDVENKSVGLRTLRDDIFFSEINEGALHVAVVAHLASLRRGTHATKTRAEVKGGGKKPWKQKGTGNARAGTPTSPLWRGGGVAFGPTPRDYAIKINKKYKKKAKISALSLKAKNKELLILDKIDIDKPSTKALVSILSAIEARRKILIVIDRENLNLSLSARNLSHVRVQRVESINAYDIMMHETLIITEDAVKIIEEGLAA